MTSRKRMRPPGVAKGGLLFSYGTLQLESVQLATIGRTLAGFADTLPRFARSMISIEDADGLRAMLGVARPLQQALH